jgi:hypothetical protein
MIFWMHVKIIEQKNVLFSRRFIAQIFKIIFNNMYSLLVICCDTIKQLWLLLFP